MAQILLFHSALGVRPGVVDAAERLRAAGHRPLPVDLYDGRVFDDYAKASAHVKALGFPELMQRAERSVAELSDRFIAAGFSNRVALAEHIATLRPVSGVLMLSGARPLTTLGTAAWPPGVPAHIHYTTNDPFRREEAATTLAQTILQAGAPLEVFDYPGGGHLFTEPSRPDEYDQDGAELLWRRMLGFCASYDPHPNRTLAGD